MDARSFWFGGYRYSSLMPLVEIHTTKRRLGALVWAAALGIINDRKDGRRRNDAPAPIRSCRRLEKRDWSRESLLMDCVSHLELLVEDRLISNQLREDLQNGAVGVESDVVNGLKL